MLLSWLLFHFGLYRHREAAELSQSDWLGTFGGSHPRDGFAPSLPGALLEGSLFAFLRGILFLPARLLRGRPV